jgi:dCMP deaminase
MKENLLKIRIQQCNLLAQASSCSRRKVSALILDPITNSIISEGFNGNPRGAKGNLCGGDICLRDKYQVASGTQNDVGCHHAEMNAILNACRLGQATQGKILIVNCDPCLMCAKAIHHAGIKQVFCPMDYQNGVHNSGLGYLKDNEVDLKKI